MNEVEGKVEVAVDVRVALEVMGWQQWHHENGDWEGGDVICFADWGDGSGVSVYEPQDDGDVSFNFSPSTNISDAFEMEEKIRGRGVEFADVYARAVANLLDVPVERAIEIRFLFLHASPEIRCRAALKAIEQ